MARTLELLHAAPVHRAEGGPPLLFIHGAYAGAWCWEHFLPWFSAHGYDAWALSLSGHGASESDKAFDLLGIRDYVTDVLEAAERLPAPPILLGHSMGGFVAQKALEKRPFPAVVLLASVPPTGLSASFWHLLTHSPQTLMEMNRLLAKKGGHYRAITQALFHHPPEAAALRRYLALSQPESLRALWDMTAFALPQRHKQHPTEWLVFGAEFDQIIPMPLVETTARHYHVPPQTLPDMGHAFMLEPQWERAATLIAQGLQRLRCLEGIIRRA